MDLVLSEIIYLTKIRDSRQTDRQTDGNGRPIPSYCRGHERSRKPKRRESVDGLDYSTSFTYAREVKRLLLPLKWYVFVSSFHSSKRIEQLVCKLTCRTSRNLMLQVAMQIILVPFWRYVSLNLKKGSFYRLVSHILLYIRVSMANGSSIRPLKLKISRNWMLSKFWRTLLNYLVLTRVKKAIQ